MTVERRIVLSKPVDRQLRSRFVEMQVYLCQDGELQRMVERRQLPYDCVPPYITLTQPGIEVTNSQYYGLKPRIFHTLKNGIERASKNKKPNDEVASKNELDKIKDKIDIALQRALNRHSQGPYYI